MSIASIHLDGRTEACVAMVAGSSWVSLQASDYQGTVTLYCHPLIANAVASAVNAPKPRVAKPHAELTAISSYMAGLTSFYEDPADMDEDDLIEAENFLGIIAALTQLQLEEVQAEMGRLSDRKVPYDAR